jgi:hypothetical protein
MTTVTAPPAKGKDDSWKKLRDSIPRPLNADSDLVWLEFEACFKSYDHDATRSRVWYQLLKVTSLLFAAAVTVLAAISAPASLTATVGAAIVVIEGIQQVFKFHTNWIRYRVVAESLREHALLYAAHQGPYADPATAKAELVKILTTLIEDERKQWSVQMSSSDKEQTLTAKPEQH